MCVTEQHRHRAGKCEGVRLGGCGHHHQEIEQGWEAGRVMRCQARGGGASAKTSSSEVEATSSQKMLEARDNPWTLMAMAKMVELVAPTPEREMTVPMLDTKMVTLQLTQQLQKRCTSCRCPG
jgi:hypothetical protein